MQPAQYYQTLLSYAYNILGSVQDAQDVVQEVLARHLGHPDPAGIRHEKAYLIRSVINLAISTKNRQQRTLRAGEVWLPEPVATDDAADRTLNLNEVLSYSLLVLLERLTAVERAVFILRESFDYTHEEIAAVLAVTPQHSRQLLSRAKAKLYKPGPVWSAPEDLHQKTVLEDFIRAISERDVQALEKVMVADIRFYIDGGGKIPLAARTCTGAGLVAALLVRIFGQFLSTARLVPAMVNHQPALLSFVAGSLTSCQIFEVHPGKRAILQMNVVLDPHKMQSLNHKNL